MSLKTSTVMRDKRKLLIDQLDRKLRVFSAATEAEIPERGWIFTIRNTLNMTLEQLGRRLNISRQGVKRIENSEMSGSITINLLREAGHAMDMKLVYGFVPRHGTVSKMIEQKSYELAKKIIQRTDQTMLLEDQATDQEHLKAAVEDLADQIRQEVRRSLWD